MLYEVITRGEERVHGPYGTLGIGQVHADEPDRRCNRRPNKHAFGDRRRSGRREPVRKEDDT